MQKIFAAAAMALPFLLTSNANATAAEDANWYAGLLIGSTKFKVDGDSARKTNYGAQLGYNFNPNVAMELQVQRLGKWNMEDASLKGSTVNLSVLGKMPVSEVFSVFGRLGWARNSVKASEDGFSGSYHKNKLLYGVGVDFKVESNVTLRAEYVNLGNNRIGDSGVSVKMQQFNVGLNFAF